VGSGPSQIFLVLYISDCQEINEINHLCTVRDKSNVLNARVKQVNRADCCNIFSVV
jgi:hypothetical protein